MRFAFEKAATTTAQDRHYVPATNPEQDTQACVSLMTILKEASALPQISKAMFKLH